MGFFDSGDLHVIVVQAGGKVVGVDASGLTTAAGMGRGEQHRPAPGRVPGPHPDPGVRRRLVPPRSPTGASVTATGR
ncbi:hypothetical protein [Curtobacterium sp. MCPF17_052]|uniref:hypothetical protein n=1 Tax=Curtobacterium sp. MCPF17_052 TaxID=2175655 RepID=UPI0024DFAB23|nr:hypothetical protein [Curtobacterium sp. MCPF17_052]WIB13413.1 hypothetical protein DEJ36_06290 [Curtobacterium sp. MCPF17_052]